MDQTENGAKNPDRRGDGAHVFPELDADFLLFHGHVRFGLERVANDVGIGAVDGELDRFGERLELNAFALFSSARIDSLRAVCARSRMSFRISSGFAVGFFSHVLTDLKAKMTSGSG